MISWECAWCGVPGVDGGGGKNRDAEADERGEDGFDDDFAGDLPVNPVGSLMERGLGEADNETDRSGAQPDIATPESCEEGR